MIGSTIWRRIAIVLAVINVAGAVFALASGEGWHAGIHVSLAIVFGLAAQRLKEGSRGGAAGSVQQQLDDQAAALEDAKRTLANQANQLNELQERVDFAERMLAQVRDRQKLGPS